MSGVRPPAVAGLFYPGDRLPLAGMVDRMLREAELEGELEGAVPKAIIAPHAGYPYSGPIAGNAFEPFRALAGKVERVVVIGPSHHVAFRGLALPQADCFETPLGRVEIDLEAAASLLELPQVRVDDRPHEREHSLEVEVPFLQQVLGRFRLVPLVTGSAAPAEVAEALARIWGGEETRIVVSSDLSHFLDYETARRTDRATADEIVGLETAIGPRQACGAVAINGLLHLAAGKALTARLLDLRNSGDTAGDRTRVVGYGAFSFETN
jgi:hypothetical protein